MNKKTISSLIAIVIILGVFGYEYFLKDGTAMSYVDEAIEQAKIIRRSFDGQMEGYYDMWIERCEYMKTQALPSDWNGVFIATSK